MNHATAVLATALGLVLAACSSAGSLAHDPGKVIQAKSAHSRPVSVPGRLYAVKGQRLFRFAGTTITALTRGAEVKDPATSADGGLVALARFENGSSHIMLTAADPFTPSAVDATVSGPGQEWAVQPAFAPDGRSLTFLSDLGKSGGPNDLGIWQVELGTQQVRRLTEPIPYTGGDSDDVFRPGADGELLFTTYLYDGEPLAPVARLTSLSMISGRQTYLSPTGERNLQPAPSPDGQFVAYIHAASGHDDLYAMPLPTRAGSSVAAPAAPAMLLSGTIAHPVWAPDGHAIAFLMLRNGSFDLYMLPVTADATGVRAAGAPVAITRGSFFDADSRLAWSP